MLNETRLELLDASNLAVTVGTPVVHVGIGGQAVGITIRVQLAQAGPTALPLTAAAVQILDSGRELQRVTLTADEVRAIRRRSGLSQAAFAAAYGLNLRTLQDREQGRAQPDRPARAYLLVIDREPRAVARALATAD